MTLYLAQRISYPYSVSSFQFGFFSDIRNHGTTATFFKEIVKGDYYV